ncbi:unnamed protein product, partial [marine sediment metagenome]
EKNFLNASFKSLKMRYKNAGIPHTVENYNIVEIKFNDSLNEATVVYEHPNPIGRESIKLHKIDGKWLIYRIFFE